MPKNRDILKLLLSFVGFAQFGSSSSWDYHRDKKSVIITFSDAEYVASTRHIMIENETCPDLDPKKLLPNDPDGARAIGGIHNRNDPVLRMLLSCESVPSWTNSKCATHPNTDLFIWQVLRYYHFLRNWIFVLFLAAMIFMCTLLFILHVFNVCFYSVYSDIISIYAARFWFLHPWNPILLYVDP